MEKKKWIDEVYAILVNEHGFDEKFAMETAEHNYEVNKDDGCLDGYTPRELIETELSYWD